MKKKAIVLWIIALFLVISAVKVYADVNSDLKDSEKLKELIQSDNLEEAKKICDKKEYFQVVCQANEITNKVDLTSEDCEEISSSNNIPYYMFFQKDNWELEVSKYRQKCQESIGVIIN